MADTSTPANWAYSIVLAGVRDAMAKLPRQQALELYDSIRSETSLLLSEHKPLPGCPGIREQLVEDMLTHLRSEVG